MNDSFACYGKLQASYYSFWLSAQIKIMMCFSYIKCNCTVLLLCIQSSVTFIIILGSISDPSLSNHAKFEPPSFIKTVRVHCTDAGRSKGRVLQARPSTAFKTMINATVCVWPRLISILGGSGEGSFSEWRRDELTLTSPHTGVLPG